MIDHCMSLMTDRDIDALACEFVHSNDHARTYAGWSIDRRIAAFLQHRGLIRAANDGDLCNILVDVSWPLPRSLTHCSDERGPPTPNHSRRPVTVGTTLAIASAARW